MKPAVIALVLCVIFAALEGAAAGSGLKECLAALRMPRWALPFRAWVVVGGVYYILCFAVLFRLLRLPASGLRAAALAVTVVLMSANAAFNFVFFRRGNLYASFLFFFPYLALALALFVLLLLVDPTSAAIFGPYLVYFPYALAWGYQVWQLNRYAVTDSHRPKPAVSRDA